MTRRVLTLAFVVLVALPAGARAQSDKLAHLLPTLYGLQGLSVNSNAPLPDGSTHSAHFNNAFQSRFNQFNAALASQLSALPLPSPSSGFTYTMDPALGVFTRSTQSFGPIMAERAETMGKGKFAFGFGVQHFGFDNDRRRRPRRAASGLHARRRERRRPRRRGDHQRATSRRRSPRRSPSPRTA